MYSDLSAPCWIARDKATRAARRLVLGSKVALASAMSAAWQISSGLLPDDPDPEDIPSEPSGLEPNPDHASDWECVDTPDPAPGKATTRRPNQPDAGDPWVPADDDSHWDVFIPDDGDQDPLPEPGDFWIDKPVGRAEEQ